MADAGQRVLCVREISPPYKGWAGSRHDRFMFMAEQSVGTPWVYFMACGDGVKVGHSTNVPKRLAEIRLSNPKPVVLVGLRPGNVKLESRFHEVLQNDGFHLCGEWFRLDSEMRGIIEGLCDE